MKRWRIVILSLFVCTYTAISQPLYPYLRLVQVHGNSTKNPTSGIFSYNYSITNGGTSIGSIIWFEVDIKSEPGTLTLDTTGLSFKNSFVERTFRSMYPGLQGKIVPVGFPNSPSFWWGGLNHSGTAMFGGDSTLIAPGSSLSGFTMTSKGLPWIRYFIASPWFDVDSLFQDLDDPNRTLSVAQEDSIRESSAFRGYTIGPQAPPAVFQPLVFVDTLSSLTTQSRSLGWITTQPVANKYTGYFTRIKTDISQFNLKIARTRIDTVLQQVNIDSSSTFTSEAYALIRFNAEYLKTQLQPTNQVKAGVFNPTGGTISVKAKPSIAFGTGDALKCMEATVRWLTSYNITLGNVSSPTYGFAKDGSITTVGSYSYQKFRTTTSQTLSWTSGTEYELFTVPITSGSGVETYRLTNGLSGGEWFVDINYLDKTDSTFYQDTANGFAYQNKSASNNATWYSGSRHVAMTSSKLHEVYASGGEIVYRRKNLSGGWEVSQRLSPGNGVGSYVHSDPGIVIAHDGSIHVVWQRWISSSPSYSVWYTRSTDAGSTWTTPDSLHPLGSVGSTTYQEGPKPVITEYATSQLVIVWQSYFSPLGTLKYITSTNLGQSWGSVQQITSVPSNTSWDPSIASYPVTSKLLLGYTPPMSSHVYSSVYSGTSWASPSNVSSGVGLNTNRYPSVAFDVDQGHFYAAWCGQPVNHTEYVIAFRSGGTNGTWGSPFAQFAIDSVGISDYYPSITGFMTGDDNIDIVYHTSNNKVKLNQCLVGSWGSTRTLSTSGQWANTSLQEQRSPNMGEGYPIRVWTDLSASPYQVTLQSDGNYSLQMVQQPGSPTFHRRVVIESEAKGSVIWFDLAPLKVVTTAGDTVSLPFAKVSPLKPFDATLTNAWDYLGTDTLTLPSNASSLLLETDITSFAKTDSLGPKYTNIFTSSTYQVDGLTTGKSVSLLASQPGVSGKTVVNVAQQAGKRVKLRMVGSVPAATKEVVAVGVGDVYLTQTP